jgi:hypothetical protein
VFASWANYYMLLGEASASLIGLLFVVSTLSVRLDAGTAATGTGLFLTPVVFTFATVVTLSAIALIPGLDVGVERGLVLATALAGTLNHGSVALSLFRGKAPGEVHWSDPWCYGAAPVLVFLGLAASALLPDPVAASRGVGGAAAVLLMLAVRNAWDLVTALAHRVRQGRTGAEG